jgi:hypothetical protein
LTLLVDSRPKSSLDSITRQVVDSGHNILITDEIESSMKICAALWNVHGIGFYDQHILFDNPYKQSGEISKVISEPDQLDEQLEDILDMIDMETAIRFLREDVRNCTKVSDDNNTREMPVNMIQAPGLERPLRPAGDRGLVFFDLKNEFVMDGSEWSAPAVSLSTLRVDYNLVSSAFSASLEAQQNTSPLVISLISRLAAKSPLDRVIENIDP